MEEKDILIITKEMSQQEMDVREEIIKHQRLIIESAESITRLKVILSKVCSHPKAKQTQAYSKGSVVKCWDCRGWTSKND